MSESQKFEQWAILEIMGHNRFAGFVSEQTIGGASFVRIDVPEVELKGQTRPAFTKIFGAASIYAISPVSEETARQVATGLGQQPMSIWDAQDLVRRLPAPESSSVGADDDDYDEPMF